MALLFSYAGADPSVWRAHFLKHLPGLDFRVFPDIGDPKDIDYAAVWMHPQGDLRNYPNLKAILSFGAGVEHIIRDGLLPAGVPIVRLVDHEVAKDMAMHVLHWIIHFHRNYHLYLADQACTKWSRYPHRSPQTRRVGFLGMGAMGTIAAKVALEMGFRVSGWGLDPVQLDNVEFFEGNGALAAFLAQTDILVNVLPLTDETRGLLNASRLALLPAGACVINVSRGPVLVEEDLIAALDSDHLGAAALDVFQTEPLPEQSGLWRHPKVFVTPHVAGVNYPDSAAKLMVENILRIEAGEQPFPQFDRVRGY
jgi:glyoxylate/hydroxypyruvate reductase A